jgi:L,D-peptidoglycan transpeptidase YkuD (ErfK/YbiS/YcfS/YnhG family)
MNEFPITYAEEIVEYDTYDADQQDAGASSASSSLSTNESESVILPTYVIKMDKERGNIYISSYKKMMTIRVDIYLHDAVGMLGHRTINGMIGRDGITFYTEPNRMGADWQIRTDTDPIFL